MASYSTKRPDSAATRTRSPLLWPALFVLIHFQAPADGVAPVIWREDSQEAFIKGEAENVSITHGGVVTLGPGFEQVADTGEEFVWALAEGRNGRLYIATGNSGRVYAYGNGKPELLLDSPEVAIFSLAVAENGALYAGSSPDGNIYRIDAGKEPTTLCRTGDRHVWALVPQPGGQLYAATGGERGRILRISSNGSVEEVYKSTDPNIISLIQASDGTLYAGTDQSGLVYRVRQHDKVDVLFDASQKEIHALALGPGEMLYAGAMTGSSKPNGGNPAPAEKPPQAGKEMAGEGSVLYAIRPSGAALKLWQTSEPLLLSLHVDAGGEITAFTGDPGSVYSVGRDGSSTLVTRMEGMQPWAIRPSGNGRFWIGAAGTGTVYRLDRSYARKGTLTSKPRDFTIVSRWGKLAWKADLAENTSTAFQTRSGNSEVPDDTWSDWSRPLTEPKGSQILSPPGRFLQYRAVMTSGTGSGTPRLRKVTMAGLQENLAPQILNLQITPPARQNDPGGNAGPGGEKHKGRPQSPESGKGIWKIAWSAGDVNADALIYDLYFRGREEKNWKLLEEDLTSPGYLWKVESAPEGTMQVRVVASDRLSNPEAQALSSESVSEPFDIDHTPPSVRLTTVRQTGPTSVSVETALLDAISPIHEASYSVNSGSWKIVFPVDEIFDSRSEQLRFTLDPLEVGEYSLVVRAADALGNVGVGKAVFEIR